MSPRPRLFTCAAIGLGLGLFAFALESALVMRQSAIGLQIDVEGPFAALIAAVRPVVPGLLLRIALAYAVAGAVAGLFAGAMTRWLRVRRAFFAGAAFLCNLAVLVALVVWDRAIARPALFDDVAFLRPLLAWTVAHGEPWHPRALAALWIGAHAGLGIFRSRLVYRGRAHRVRYALAVLIVAAAATQLWAHTFRRAVPSPVPVAAGEGTKRPKLVVLFGIDAFRPDRLKAEGGSGRIAPNLEALLEEGTLFTNAWTPIAQTEPAWRSLLTARWPHQHGLRYPLTAESRWVPSPTFAGTLASAGWHTAFATDCSRFNYQTGGTGFAQRLQPPRGAINFVLEKLRYRLLGAIADNAVGARLVPEMIDNRALAGLHDAAGYGQRLAEAIADRAEEGPTFFAYHATAAHFPGDPSYPFYRGSVRADAPLERRLRMFFAPIAQGGARAQTLWSREDAEALYDALLSQADAQLGMLIAELKSRGLYDDAAIIVFSDHGESFHEDHPELAGATSVHGARLSELENRILLAVKLPRAQAQRAPRQVDALVRLIDIGPTVLALAGVPPLIGVDGRNLLPLLEGGGLPEPLLLYAETGFTHASPAAFDADHLAQAPRTFDIYRVRRDGVVEIHDEVHDAILREKDVGAYDGATWLIRSPRADGDVQERCVGACPAPARLEAFLDQQLGVQRLHAGTSSSPPGPLGTAAP